MGNDPFGDLLGAMCAIGTVGVVSFGVYNYFHSSDLFVKKQVGENVYEFVCKEHDRLEKTCDTKQHLWIVYEHATLETIADAPTTWIKDTNNTGYCSLVSYQLDQCYDVGLDLDKLYQRYMDEKTMKEKQNE